MQDALPDNCTAALVNECTNLITDDVPAVLHFLFCNFGKVISEEVE